MAKTKYFEIYGETFEYCGTIKCANVSERTLDDCYARPSAIKANIWNSWLMWFVNDCRSVKFGIRSYNQFFFTIEGIIELDGHKWYLNITAKHNRAYLIEM